MIDLRQNGGGDFFEGRKHLIQPLKKIPAINQYYKFLDQDVPAVIPDKRIDPNWPDFQAGRDPVMDWILSSNSAK